MQIQLSTMLLEISLLHFVAAFAAGNNFPPVENPVPVPGPAVKAPLHILQSGIYFANPGRDFSRESPDPSQSWEQNPLFQYVPPASSVESSERRNAFEDFDRLYDNGIPAVGPVATPTPDGDFESSNKKEIPSQLRGATVVLPPDNFWYRRNNLPYVMQRVVSVPVPSDPTSKKYGGFRSVPVSMVASKTPNVIAGGFGNPVFTIGNIRFSGPRIQSPPAAIIDEFTNQKNKNVQKNQATTTVKTPTVEMPPVDITQYGSKQAPVTLQQVRTFPRIMEANMKNKDIQIVPAMPSRDMLGPNIIGWMVSADGRLTPIRGVFTTPQFPQYPPILNPVTPAKMIALTSNAKSPLPIEAPSRLTIGNTWVLRQGPGGPFFERLRTLLPNVEVSKGQDQEVYLNGGKMQQQIQYFTPKSGSISPGTLVYRRGNKETQVDDTKINTLPHSPKSDVLVIGKGNTLAHLAPQKNTLPDPPPTNDISPSKPCLISKVYSPFLGPSTYVAPSPNFMPFARKGMPVAGPLRAFRPYSRYVWNPNMNTKPYYRPQIAEQRFPDIFRNSVPKQASVQTNSITRNRFQHPLRYSNPLNLPPIFDMQGGKPVGIEVIPPPIPEVNPSSKETSVQQSSEKPNTPAKDLASASSSPSSSADSIENEASIIHQLQAHASQVEPSFAPINTLKGRTADSSSIQYKQKVSESSGKVEGTFGLKDASSGYTENAFLIDHSTIKEFDAKLLTLPSTKSNFVEEPTKKTMDETHTEVVQSDVKKPDPAE